MDHEDEIGVFVNDQAGAEILVGACVLGEVVGGHFFVHVYGDDSTTPEKDGAASGEALIFKIWDASQARELIAPPQSMQVTTDPVFSLPGIPPVWRDGLTFGFLNLAVFTSPLPDNPVADGSVVSADAVNNAAVSNITINPGVTVYNSGGAILGAQNSGVIVGGQLGGHIANNGIIRGNVSLAEGAVVTGGTISGTVRAEGTGASAIDAIIEAAYMSNVHIGEGCRLRRNSVANLPGLTLTGAITGTDGVIHPDRPLLIDEAGAEISLSRILSDLVNHLLGDITCTAVSDASGRVLLSSQMLGNIIIPGIVQSVVTTSEEDGVSPPSSGELTLIRNGLATTLAPASVDWTSLESALQPAGCSLTRQDAGIATVGLPDGARLSFRFNNFATRSGVSPASGVSFSVAGTPEDPETFRLTVKYPDGSAQILLPALHDFSQLKAVLEANNIAYSLHPSTGVIQILDSMGLPIWRGIASYFVETPPAGATGFSLEPAGDRNNDGTSDFYMITGSARQIIHTLP